MQSQDVDCLFKTVSERMDEARRSLNDIGRNLVGLLHDLNGSPQCAALMHPNVARLETEARTLSRNFDALLSAASASVLAQKEITAVASMADPCAEVEELRSKALTLQRENDKATAQLSIAQAENLRLRSQLTHQSAFCASLGSVLGTLVWKASRVPPVVDLLLSGTKATDFLCIVSGTLDSFLETFNTEMPGPSADESQFIMAMGGIVTNMAAAPAGRQFLVSDPNGRDLIQQIVRVLPVVPTPSGTCLKRLLLMTLYNVSINEEGLSLLLRDGKGAIFSVVGDCLRSESTKELKIMALRLLISLTCEMESQNLVSQVPKQLITKLAESDNDEIRSLALDVQENLSKAEERLKQSSTKQSGGTSHQHNCKSPINGAEGQDRRHPAACWLPS